MYFQNWGDVIVYSLQQSWQSVANFIPVFIGAVVVFLIGWIVAVALGKVVEQVIRALKVDQLLSRLDFEKTLDRAGMHLNSGAFIGGLVRWFLIVVFMLAAVNILGDRFSPVSAFLVAVLTYIPNVLVAAVILVIAALVADTLEQVVRGSVAAAGFRGSFAGVVTRWAIWIFAIIAAMQQLGVATLLLQTLLTGLVAMLAIAFGLAFGLGGKDVAASFLDRMKRDMSDHHM